MGWMDGDGRRRRRKKWRMRPWRCIAGGKKRGGNSHYIYLILATAGVFPPFHDDSWGFPSLILSCPFCFRKQSIIDEGCDSPPPAEKKERK